MRAVSIYLLRLLSYTWTVTSLVSTANAFSVLGGQQGQDRKKQVNPVEQIRNAMQLTNEGQANITAAYSAVSLWSNILVSDEDQETTPQIKLQKPIRILCNSLYASSLSRTGRDQDALIIYDETLSLLKNDAEDNNSNSNPVGTDFDVENSVLIDVRIGRGEALQRLMRYKEAGNEFLIVCQLGGKMQILQENRKFAKCAYSAALCSLRLGDLEGAECFLSSLFDGLTDLSGVDCNLIGLFGAIRLELGQKKKIMDVSSIAFTPLQMLEHAATHNASPVYRWFHALASKLKCVMFQSGNSATLTMEEEELLEVAAINGSPFDDPALIQMDDKVLLHNLLRDLEADISISSRQYWPGGFILPRDQDKLLAYCAKNQDSCQWIIKERAGYGSHGNTIASSGQKAVEISKVCQGVDSKYSVLCQKLIEPSLLFHERKFSIRVYVVYFNRSSSSKEEISYFLLNCGLAKLAEEEYVNQAGYSIDNIFMTNSGRIEGDGMIQYDFDCLREYMNNQYGNNSFDRMWKKIDESVADVMQKFQRAHDAESTNSSLLFFSVPKIMGFDYIIDSFHQPWLMEVNRFPGLEARGEIDNKVKTDVVIHAWELASRLCRTNYGLAIANEDCGSSSLDQKSANSVHVN